MTVQNLVHEITISSQEILVPVPSSELVFSQRQQLFDSHLAQIPITPKQQGKFEKREEVHASAGAQDRDISCYELSELEDIEFFREKLQVELVTAFTPRIDTLFSPTASIDLEMEKEDHPKTQLCWMKRLGELFSKNFSV